MFTYDFPRPALSTDVALISGERSDLSVLLIRRRFDPFAGHWALPGGFVEEGERIEDAARRELSEETGILWTRSLSEVGTFGEPGRDPRGWTVSVVWAAHVGEDPLPAKGGDDAEEAAWFRVSELPRLAFDHGEIFSVVLKTMFTG